MSNTSATFRSVLPHEPLPHERFGYVQIQGNLTPKFVAPNNELLSDQSKTSFFNTSSVVAPDNVREMLLKALSADSNYLPLDSPLLKLPTELTRILDVQLLDANRNRSDGDPDHLIPITKARITYPSPTIARKVVAFLKEEQISPHHLCHLKLSDETDFEINDYILQAYSFTQKVIQATQVTQIPLPDTSIAWPRVGMPKFRRLLPTEMDKQNPQALIKIQQQRDTTRFVFMTNIMIEHADCPCVFEFQDAIRNALKLYCDHSLPVEVFLPSKRQSTSYKYCHIGTRSPIDARTLIKELQGQNLTLTLSDNIKLSTGSLFLDFADVTQRCAVQTNRFFGKPSINIDDPSSLCGVGEPPRPECTSVTRNIKVPGLVCIENFVSEQEERALLAVLTGPHAPWAPAQKNFSKTGTLKRRVQHYGYVFDYETADVLRNREMTETKNGMCPPLPALPKGHQSWDLEALEKYISDSVTNGNGWGALAGIVERVRRYNFGSRLNDSYQGDNIVDEMSHGLHEINPSLNNINVTSQLQQVSGAKQHFPFINQVTVNEYKRGQGIGSHVDTLSAFDDGILSLSLGSGCVMEFHEPVKKCKKLVYLPQRSLLLMSGPARYAWEHMIVTRGTDCVDGNVLQRKTRISLTLRTAISLPHENGSVEPLPLVTTNDYPPQWGSDERMNGLNSGFATPETERNHVHAVYDAIATQWHHTRGKRGVLWPGATNFLNSLKKGSIVCDVGCGDGKYFPAIWESGSYVIGTDISEPLLQTSIGACKEHGSKDAGPQMRLISKENVGLNKRPAIAVADCMHIPIQSRSVDAALCIAVMHHLSTVSRRIRCLKELARIVKIGGSIIIQAWALEQNQDSRRKFAGNDVFVPFNAQPRYLNKVSTGEFDNEKAKSAAEVYSDAYQGAEYDETKGLVVFQRYCHMYRQGELENLIEQIDELEVVESAFESGNWQVILRVKS
jgi:alkylated DNA repair protein alkB family protein 8